MYVGEGAFQLTCYNSRCIFPPPFTFPVRNRHPRTRSPLFHGTERGLTPAGAAAFPARRRRLVRPRGGRAAAPHPCGAAPAGRRRPGRAAPARPAAAPGSASAAPPSPGAAGSAGTGRGACWDRPRRSAVRVPPEPVALRVEIRFCSSVPVRRGPAPPPPLAGDALPQGSSERRSFDALESRYKGCLAAI